MTTPIAYQIRDVALDAGWSDEDMRLAALNFEDANQMRQVAGLKVSERVRNAILRMSAKAAPLGAARVRTFRDAAEIEAVCRMDGISSLPANLRDPLNYFENGRMLPAAEVKRRIQNELAGRDEHINTARPEGAVYHGVGDALSLVNRETLERLYGAEAVAKMEKAQ